ncbi:MAG: deoxyribose-phosphate aldolase [Flavobacteriales bacterium CG_4_9_14_3_um_filter_40_17]|nr:MAG: deoxyribose-phosphate aldolase [Flavobacteriales bacterium CG_4_9_14_3_um_filter_40_17]
MILNDYIDHTLLKPTATTEDIRNLCDEAERYNFYAVCVNGSRVADCKIFLKSNRVKIAAVVGFPLGASLTDVKIFEAVRAIEDGADEIDMVINVGWLKEGRVEDILKEIKQIKQVVEQRVLKVIIETCFLSKAEIVQVAEICVAAGADFVKTSTGFGTGGATFEDVILIKKTVGNRAKIKAAGGIKDKEAALKYLSLGVTRLGTSSGIALVEGIVESGGAKY